MAIKTRPKNVWLVTRIADKLNGYGYHVYLAPLLAGGWAKSRNSKNVIHFNSEKEANDRIKEMADTLGTEMWRGCFAVYAKVRFPLDN